MEQIESEINGSSEPRSVPYGFRFLWQYTGQCTAIKSLVYNGINNQFATLDSKSVKVWGKKGTTEYCRLAFPPTSPNFIQAIVYISTLRIYLAAALDMHIKIYNHNLKRVDAIKMNGPNKKGERAVMSLAFNEQTNDLICGSVDGCSVYKFEKHMADMWIPGRSNIIYELKNCRRLVGCSGWVGKIVVDSDRLIIFQQESVLWYASTTLEPSGALKEIHGPGVTGCLFLPSLQYMVTSGKDTTIKVWSIIRDNTQAHCFVKHTKAVTGLVKHPTKGLVLSSSLDGTVRVWDLNHLKELYKLDVMAPIIEIASFNQDCITLLTTDAVLAWRLHHVTTQFVICRSPVSSLTRHENPHVETKLALRAALSIKWYEKMTGRACGNKERTSLIHDLVHYHNFDDVSGVVVMSSIDGSSRLVSVATGQHRCTVLPDKRSAGAYQSIYSAKQSLLFSLVPQKKRHRNRKLAKFDHLSVANEDVIRVYSTRKDPGTLVQRWPLSTSFQEATDTKYRLEPVTSITLCDLIPLSVESPRQSKNKTTTTTMIVQKYSMPQYRKQVQGRIELLVGATTKGRLIFWDTRNKGDVVGYAQVERDSIVRVLYDRVGKAFITLSVTARLQVIRAIDFKVIHRVAIDEEQGILSCLNMSPTSQLILLGFQSGNMLLFDIHKGIFRPLGHDYEHSGEVTCADFLDAVELFVTGSRDGTLKIWTFDKKLLREIKMTQPVYAVRFLDPSGNIIVGEGQNVSIIEAKTYLTRQWTVQISKKLLHYCNTCINDYIRGRTPASAADSTITCRGARGVLTEVEEGGKRISYPSASFNTVSQGKRNVGDVEPMRRSLRKNEEDSDDKEEKVGRTREAYCNNRKPRQARKPSVDDDLPCEMVKTEADGELLREEGESSMKREAKVGSTGENVEVVSVVAKPTSELSISISTSDSSFSAAPDRHTLNLPSPLGPIVAPRRNIVGSPQKPGKVSEERVEKNKENEPRTAEMSMSLAEVLNELAAEAERDDRSPLHPRFSDCSDPILLPPPHLHDHTMRDINSETNDMATGPRKNVSEPIVLRTVEKGKENDTHLERDGQWVTHGGEEEGGEDEGEGIVEKTAAKDGNVSRTGSSIITLSFSSQTNEGEIKNISECRWSRESHDSSRSRPGLTSGASLNRYETTFMTTGRYAQAQEIMMNTRTNPIPSSSSSSCKFPPTTTPPKSIDGILAVSSCATGRPRDRLNGRRPTLSPHPPPSSFNTISNSSSSSSSSVSRGPYAARVVNLRLGNASPRLAKHEFMVLRKRQAKQWKDENRGKNTSLRDVESKIIASSHHFRSGTALQKFLPLVHPFSSR